MPRPCSICGEVEGVIVGAVHPKRSEIDSALMAGTPLRDIARRSATSKDAVSRHKGHVKTAMVKATQSKEVKAKRSALTVLQRIERLAADAEDLFREAKETGDSRAALVAIREIRETLKTLLDVETEASKGGGAVAQSVEFREYTRWVVRTVCEPCKRTLMESEPETAGGKR